MAPRAGAMRKPGRSSPASIFSGWSATSVAGPQNQVPPRSAVGPLGSSSAAAFT